jgi:site-specific recombinase XerD
MMSPPTFSAILQRFFTDRLIGQLGASPNTVAGYRDTFRLLLGFAARRLRRQPSAFRLDDIDNPLVCAFLDHLESERHCSPRTRNTRLAALHSFFKYVALSEPELALHCQRILAIPCKRYDRGPVEFLTAEEVSALLGAPDLTTWVGRRDRALLTLAVQTGLRNAELTSLRRQDVELGTGAHVRCQGKGRKTRCTPLRPDVATLIKEWLSEQDGRPDQPLFPSQRGGRLSSDGVQRMVSRHVATAQRDCRSLASKEVRPHTLRHTAAMELLRRGVDASVIALWLGHESVETTQIYLHADMSLKEKALAHADPSGAGPRRYRAPDALLAFLEAL